MKTFLRSSPIFLFLAAALGAVADAPRVTRPLLRTVEKSFNERIARIWPDNPGALAGEARGVYLEGYGVVFTTEVNTASEGISLMHLTVTPKEQDQIHRLKIDRVPQLKKALEEALVDSAASLDTVPLDEQVVVEVVLDRYTWEAAGGYPAEILLQASRRKLLDVKLAKGAGMDLAIRVTEH
jgi:hypothetical protein